MEMEGTVRNVTSFGAFVDIGVHEDGLVHISQLADRFVKDPNEIVHVGQVVHTRILEVDPKRKRIALTMRTQSAPEASNRSADRKTADSQNEDRGNVDRRDENRQNENKSK